MSIIDWIEVFFTSTLFITIVEKTNSILLIVLINCTFRPRIKLITDIEILLKNKSWPKFCCFIKNVIWRNICYFTFIITNLSNCSYFTIFKEIIIYNFNCIMWLYKKEKKRNIFILNFCLKWMQHTMDIFSNIKLISILYSVLILI